MEGEFNNFIMVWTSALLSLGYCNLVRKFVPKGMPRLVALLPVMCLFVILPFKFLYSCNLGLLTFFCLSWTANFKLLLLSFDTGPLSDPSLPRVHFVVLACLPIIKIQETPTQSPQKTNNNEPKMGRNGQCVDIPSSNRTSKSSSIKSPSYTAKKSMFFPFIFLVYAYKESIHPIVLIHLYTLYLYISLEVVMAMIAMITQSLLKLELEPAFNEPFFSTSLREFWGRRWNMVSTNILRSTIFNPIFHYISKTLDRTRAWIFALVGTFLVSVLMHELLYYQIFRIWPTGSFTYFLAVQGLCLVVEGGLKNTFTIARRPLPPPIVFIFTMTTFACLVMADLVEKNLDTVLVKEYLAALELLMNVVGFQVPQGYVTKWNSFTNV